MKTTETNVLLGARRHSGAYSHEAVFYEGLPGFLEATVPFVLDAVDAGEPTLVAVIAERAEPLRAALGAAADQVLFADMESLGRNPARIIPAWRAFVTDYSTPAEGSAPGGRPVRGIGEPIWSTRTPEELVECQRHESLLNLAFDRSDNLWLICPYDTESLPDDVLIEAERSHPVVVDREGAVHRSRRYRGRRRIPATFSQRLSPAPADAATLHFGALDLEAVRAFVARETIAAGLRLDRISEVMLAVNEVATNSVLHGGGGGAIRSWTTSDEWICEIADGGVIRGQPLLGRELPRLDGERGRGLWLVNQLCDLVEQRVFPDGVIVRMHIAFET